MTVRCGKCDSLFKDSDIVTKCVECKLGFHASCTRVGSTPNFSNTRKKTLKCDSCADESKSNSSVRSTDDGEDKKSILEAIKSMKSEINKNIDDKIGSVLMSVGELQSDIKSINDGIYRLDGEQEELRERCDKMEHVNEELTAEVRDLQLRLHDAEQYSRAANIEIVGLPATPAESIYTCLQHVAGALGINFSREDISLAHRLRSYSGRIHSHPPIIVQFVSRSIKDTWMRAMREKKNLTSGDIHNSLPPSKVYINDHLTPHNKALLGKARRLRKEKKISFAGFFNGKVIVKAAEGDEGFRVTSLEDLDRFDTRNIVAS